MVDKFVDDHTTVITMVEVEAEANTKPAPETESKTRDKETEAPRREHEPVNEQRAESFELTPGQETSLAMLEKAIGELRGTESGADPTRRAELDGHIRRLITGLGLASSSLADAKRRTMLARLSPEAKAYLARRLAGTAAAQDSDAISTKAEREQRDLEPPEAKRTAALERQESSASASQDRAASVDTRALFEEFPERTVIDTEGLEQQAQFLEEHIPGLTAVQAIHILAEGFKRNSTVVLGGSRVRGDFKPTSDLDVGWGNLPVRQAQRIIKKLNKGSGDGLRLEKLPIVPGNETASIAKILSPEEFFQRFGIRAGGDNRAGEPFVASGFVTLHPDGRIEIVPPRSRDES